MLLSFKLKLFLFVQISYRFNNFFTGIQNDYRQLWSSIISIDSLNLLSQTTPFFNNEEQNMHVYNENR